METQKTATISRQQSLTDLYQLAFPKVAGFIHKMGGSLEDARDVFHDALVILYEKKEANILVVNVEEQAYLMGIVKNLWYKKFKQQTLLQPLNSETFVNPADEEPRVSDSLIVFLESSGKKCLDLLTAFYYDKVTMKDLAKQFGFSGERSATAQKFKCLEKVRTAVKNRSLNKEDFYE